MEKEKSKNRQYSLKAMQGLMKQNLDGSPIYELKDIEVCKSEIESWYEWDTFNPCFVSGFDKDEALKKLSALKALRPKREPFYIHSHENKQILNLICEYSDVVDFKQVNNQRPHKLVLLRDERVREWRSRVALYEKAKSRIENKIQKENQKLAQKDSFYDLKPPFRVVVISDIENNIIKPAKDGSKKGEREISRFIKELSVALFQSYPVDNQRAIEICEILEAFFGISPTLADPDNIRKYIQGEIL